MVGELPLVEVAADVLQKLRHPLELLHRDLLGAEHLAAGIFAGDVFVVAAVDILDELVGFGAFACEKVREILLIDPPVLLEEGGQLLEGVGRLVKGGLPAEHLEPAAAADPLRGAVVDVLDARAGRLPEPLGDGVDRRADLLHRLGREGELRRDPAVFGRDRRVGRLGGL